MCEEQRVVAVIPARYASSRFPGKPLALIGGKPMIERVYERAAAAENVDEVLVATDDERIRRAVLEFGGAVVLTSPEHQTGTDRIAEAIQRVSAGIVVNVQGDEPVLPSHVLDELVLAMKRTGAAMGTVAVPFSLTDRDPSDPNAVKVVLDRDGYALYFSRAPIPHCRDGGRDVEPLLHWGLYAYRRTLLEQFVTWPRGELEACELLEQLRALENGVRILVIRSQEQSLGVDVPDDVPRVEQFIREQDVGGG